MPPNLTDDRQRSHAFIQLLDDNLAAVRAASQRYHAEVLHGRQSAQSAVNEYQQGDFVLFDMDSGVSLKVSKLTLKFSGPFEVISQLQNDVTCRHMASGVVKVLHVSRLKVFHGSPQEAFNMAILDADQYLIARILDFTGDPTFRMSMKFRVLFTDGDIKWLPYSKDISDTVQFEEYCNSFPPIRVLLFKHADVLKVHSQLNRSAITTVAPGDIYYVPLRAFGFTWYDSISAGLDVDKLYVVEGQFRKWKSAKHLAIDIYYPAFGTEHVVTNVFISQFC